MNIIATTHAKARLMQRHGLISEDIEGYLSTFLNNFKGVIKGDIDVIIYPNGNRLKLYGKLKNNSFKIITVLRN